MSVAFRAKTTVSASGTSVTLTKPTGTVDDDIIVVGIIVLGASISTAPTGWKNLTAKGVFDVSSSPPGTGVLFTYGKKASSEGSSWEWELSASKPYAAFAASYSGCTLADIFVDAATTDQLVAGPVSTIDATGVQTSVANDMLLSIVAGRSTGSAFAGTPPGSMTGRVNVGTVPGIAMADLLLSTIQTTPTETFTGGSNVYAPCFATITLLSLPPPPSGIAITPAAGSVGGGDLVEITGANLTGTTGVTLDGTAATSITVLNDGSLTCVSAAGTLGTGDVVVTTPSGSGTLTNGWTYLEAHDNSVKLVKGGTITGSEKANASTVKWPATGSSVAAYGGPSDLWGTTLTPADINGGTFGCVVSAVVGAGQALIDSIRMTVYYTVPGVADPIPLLVALKVGSDGQTVTPEVYQIPRANMTPGNDPQINHAVVDEARLTTSRFWQPSRAIQKTYRDVEWWQEQSPSANVPGVTVKAILDDGSAVQLVDANGDAATFVGTGQKIGYFPATSAAVGHYLQLQISQPIASGQLGAPATTIRDIIIHGSYDPITTNMIRATFILGPGEFEDRQSMRRTAKEQYAALRALMDPQAAPVSYTDPDTGVTGYLKVVSVESKELTFKGEETPTFVATVIMRQARYS